MDGIMTHANYTEPKWGFDI